MVDAFRQGGRSGQGSCRTPDRRVSRSFRPAVVLQFEEPVGM